MRNILLTLIIWALVQKISFGQDSTRTKYRITVTPTQFVLLDFPLSIERVFKRHTLGLTIAYRPSTKNSGEVHGGAGLAGGYKDQNFRNPMYDATTVGLNSKYYFNKKKHLFLDATVFYRYWWFDKKDCEYKNIEGYRFKGTRTERQQVVGFKLLFGRSFQPKTKSKIKPIIDLYCGMGMRYKTYVFETFDGTVSDAYYTYYKETGGGWLPSIQAGVKLGIGIP
ncbi:MAG: hypothetical protein V4714_22905 [Bacteroidota bacterium]